MGLRMDISCPPYRAFARSLSCCIASVSHKWRRAGWTTLAGRPGLTKRPQAPNHAIRLVCIRPVGCVAAITPWNFPVRTNQRSTALAFAFQPTGVPGRDSLSGRSYLPCGRSRLCVTFTAESDQSTDATSHPPNCGCVAHGVPEHRCRASLGRHVTVSAGDGCGLYDGLKALSIHSARDITAGKGTAQRCTAARVRREQARAEMRIASRMTDGAHAVSAMGWIRMSAN